MRLLTVTVSDKGQISIPKSVREDLGIKRGEELVMIEEEGKIVLEQAKKVARKLAMLNKGESLATMLASEKSLAKDWGSEEDERWNSV